MSSLRLSRKSAPAFAPRESSSREKESTLTFSPAPFSARTEASRCGKGVSGRPPRSITSAPRRARSRPRARICSGVIFEASTISEKIRTSCRDRSRLRPARPSHAGRSTISSGPRSTGRPKCCASASGFARQRPGRTRRVAPSGISTRRLMISSVISAATFTPASAMLQRMRAGRLAAIFSRRGRASLPVTKTMCSGAPCAGSLMRPSCRGSGPGRPARRSRWPPGSNARRRGRRRRPARGARAHPRRGPPGRRRI